MQSPFPKDPLQPEPFRVFDLWIIQLFLNYNKNNFWWISISLKVARQPQTHLKWFWHFELKVRLRSASIKPLCDLCSPELLNYADVISTHIVQMAPRLSTESRWIESATAEKRWTVLLLASMRLKRYGRYKVKTTRIMGLETECNKFDATIIIPMKQIRSNTSLPPNFDLNLLLKSL